MGLPEGNPLFMDPVRPASGLPLKSLEAITLSFSRACEIALVPLDLLPLPKNWDIALLLPFLTDILVLGVVYMSKCLLQI